MKQARSDTCGVRYAAQDRLSMVSVLAVNTCVQEGTAVYIWQECDMIENSPCSVRGYFMIALHQ